MIYETLRTEMQLLRFSLWKWVAQKLRNIPPNEISVDELLVCLPFLYCDVENKNEEFRQNAKDALSAIMMHLGLETMLSLTDACEMEQASRNNLRAALQELHLYLPTDGFPELENSQKRKPEHEDIKDKTHLSIFKEVKNYSLLSINNLKYQRAVDEQNKIIPKWNSVKSTNQLVNLLKLQMTQAGVRTMLINNLFHITVKHRLKALDYLSENLSKDNRPTLSNLDLILKWSTLRLLDTNTTMVLKVLNYLRTVFKALIDYGYHLTEYEASSFIPHLISSLGHTRDVVRSSVRLLFCQLYEVYSASKLFTLLIEGLKSDNALERQECLNELSYLIYKHGLCMCQPELLRAVKEIVKTILDREGFVRDAALKCVLKIQTQSDEIVHMLRNIQISDKDRSFINERLRKANIRKRASPSSAETPKLLIESKNKKNTPRMLSTSSPTTHSSISLNTLSPKTLSPISPSACSPNSSKTFTPRIIPPKTLSLRVCSPISLITFSPTTPSVIPKTISPSTLIPSPISSKTSSPIANSPMSSKLISLRTSSPIDSKMISPTTSSFIASKTISPGKLTGIKDKEEKMNKSNLSKTFPTIFKGKHQYAEKIISIETSKEIMIDEDKKEQQDICYQPTENVFRALESYKEIKNKEMGIKNKENISPSILDILKSFEDLKNNKDEDLQNNKNILQNVIATIKNTTRPYGLGNKILTSIENFDASLQEKEVHNINSRASTFHIQDISAIYQIGSYDPEVALKGIELIKNILENANGDYMITFEEQIIKCVVTQFKLLSTYNSEDERISVITASLISLLCAFYSGTIFGKSICEFVLKDLMKEILTVQYDRSSQMYDFPVTYELAIDDLCINIIKQSDSSNILCALLKLIHCCYATSQPARYATVVINKLWFIIIRWKSFAYNLNTNRILSDIHSFLETYPFTFWVNHPNNAASRTVRSILNELLKNQISLSC